MEIYSVYQNPSEFKKLRRKKWNPFRYLASGEWSEDVYHQGSLTYDFSETKTGGYVALLVRSFPRRIVCIARKSQDDKYEDIFTQMLFHLYLNGYYSMDYLDDYDKKLNSTINFSVAFDTFRKLVREHRKSTPHP